MSDLINTGVWANCQEIKYIRLMGEVNCGASRICTKREYTPEFHAIYRMVIKVDGKSHFTCDEKIAANLLALKHGLPAIEDRLYILDCEGEFLIDREAWEKFKGGEAAERDGDL